MGTAHLSDRDLTRRAVSGDPRAVSALWSRHRRWVAAVLLAHKAPHAELEDLLQEVALSLLRGIGQLRDPDRFRPWLRRVAVNVARASGRTRPGPAPELRGGADEQMAAAAMRSDRRLRALEREVQDVLSVVLRLPAPYREPLMLRSVEALSQKEIAEAMGLSEEAVESRLARARRMLRERLDQSGKARSRRMIGGCLR